MYIECGPPKEFDANEIFLIDRATDYLEAGLFVKLIKHVYRAGYEAYIRQNVLFVSLEQYKKGLIKFDEMRFENYEVLLVVYLAVCLSILAVFVFMAARNRLHRTFYFSYRYRIRRLRKHLRKRLRRDLKRLWLAIRNFFKNLLDLFSKKFFRKNLKRKTSEPNLQEISAKKIKINFLQQNLFRVYSEEF